MGFGGQSGGSQPPAGPHPGLTLPVLAAVPVKRFGVAKRRLAPLLSSEARAALGRDLAARTLTRLAETGADVLTLAADEEVASWSAEHGWEAMVDTGTGLDAAAAGAVARTVRQDRAWMVVHADLPLLSLEEATDAVAAASQGAVIAPSDDGGTSLLAGKGSFSFAYGPGSFHRHLSRLDQPRVITATGWLLDLDGPDDLLAVLRHPRGAWLAEYAGPSQ